MARPLRIDWPGAGHHVTGRWNGGESIFHSDTDRRRFLGLISELPGRFGLEIHAFVLMDNHYHLLVRSVSGNHSEAVCWLQVSHAVRHNLVHRRRGHLYQRRFKSKLILDKGALNRVGRYLRLNPVRIAGLGLSKPDQRRARVLGCPDPGKELVARHMSVLRE